MAVEANRPRGIIEYIRMNKYMTNITREWAPCSNACLFFMVQ